MQLDKSITYNFLQLKRFVVQSRQMFEMSKCFQIHCLFSKDKLFWKMIMKNHAEIVPVVMKQKLQKNIASHFPIRSG